MEAPDWSMGYKNLIAEIGKIRWWFEGYAAAGGTPPHGLEALRQSQIIFDSLDKEKI